MDAEPKRAWWRKKRWRIVAAVLLLGPASYPGSMAPAAYAIGRGWLDESTLESAYRPVIDLMDDVTDAGQPNVGVATAVLPDGRVVTSRSRAEVAWWAPPAASLVRGYWDFVNRCAEAGARHRG